MRVIGIDLSKAGCHVVAMDERGKVVLKRKASRSQLKVLLANTEPSLVGMEASCGAHHLAREIQALGHEVKLMAGQYVKPFVKTNKNDWRDAEAIAEAVQRPTMRFVPVKTEEQLDLQALHRVRERLVARRTGVINQLRAFLMERGLTVRVGRVHLWKALPELMALAAEKFSGRMQNLLRRLSAEWEQIEQSVDEVNAEIGSIARSDDHCARLLEVPGVGPMIATAMVAAVGNGSAFQRGREFATWLGLVPRQHSTGGKTKLLGISKRGNCYLRGLFLRGARSVLLRTQRDKHSWGPWVNELATRAHPNVVAVALAHKLARIAWAVLCQGSPYRLAVTAAEAG
jgi:transposase